MALHVTGSTAILTVTRKQTTSRWQSACGSEARRAAIWRTGNCEQETGGFAGLPTAVQHNSNVCSLRRYNRTARGDRWHGGQAPHRVYSVTRVPISIKLGVCFSITLPYTLSHTASPTSATEPQRRRMQISGCGGGNVLVQEYRLSRGEINPASKATSPHKPTPATWGGFLSRLFTPRQGMMLLTEGCTQPGATAGR
jgi:hypothetical protein